MRRRLAKVGAAAQQRHRTFDLFLGVDSRAEPRELDSWSHVAFPRILAMETRHSTTRKVLSANPHCCAKRSSDN